MTTSPSTPPARSSGRGLLVLGFGLALLGIAGYAVQLSTKRLVTPWYMPTAATLGVLCLFLALRRRRSVWRVLGLVLLILLAGLEWAVLLSAQLPAYTGPVAEGKPFPAFTTTRPDGSSFSQRDLEGGPNHVLVFFRGRW